MMLCKDDSLLLIWRNEMFVQSLESIVQVFDSNRLQQTSKDFKTTSKIVEFYKEFVNNMFPTLQVPQYQNQTKLLNRGPALNDNNDAATGRIVVSTQAPYRYADMDCIQCIHNRNIQFLSVQNSSITRILPFGTHYKPFVRPVEREIIFYDTQKKDQMPLP